MTLKEIVQALNDGKRLGRVGRYGFFLLDERINSLVDEDGDESDLSNLSYDNMFILDENQHNCTPKLWATPGASNPTYEPVCAVCGREMELKFK